MLNRGWIKLHRKIREGPFWNEKPFDRARAWVDLIMSANHERRKFLLGNEMVEVDRGSFITSEQKLMERWGWSKSKVRAFLKILEKNAMIIKKSDHRKTIVEVLNYCLYQDSETSKEPRKDRERTCNEPVKDLNKNKRTKELKNENGNEPFPHLEMHETFNRICVSFAKVQKMTNSRKDKLRIRWTEIKTMETFELICLKMESSNFLKGDNPRKWKATFDWLIENDNNWVKVTEGNYEDKVEKPKEGGVTYAWELP